MDAYSIPHLRKDGINLFHFFLIVRTICDYLLSFKVHPEAFDT